MVYGRTFVFSTLAVVTVLPALVQGQSVISARSGVVHFFEGAVYLGGDPLEPRFGKFPAMAQGAELRTAQGRAEVLLTPGVFLRLGERSAIRLVANDLADTRVELMAGSAIVESAEPSPGTSVTLVYKGWNVHFLQKGVYRIDAEPPCLRVNQGEAEVSGGAGPPLTVKQGMDLPLAAVLVPERIVDMPGDALTDWAKGRSESISADNAITAQIDEDPASRNSDLPMDGGFAYFPLIGVPSVGSGLYGAYGSYYPYQPGFSSIYLPGYTYRPLILGLTPGYRSYPSVLYSAPYSVPYSGPRRIGISPLTHPVVPAPHVPVSHTAPGQAAPHVGVHVGGRR